MGGRGRRPAHRHTGSTLSAHRGAGGGARLSPRRTPDRLPGIVDSHAHLQHAAFDADRDAVVERAVAAGVERIVVPGWDLASSEAALELAERHRGIVSAAVGVHPHDAVATDEAAWRQIEALAGDRRCVAIGEIGLDYFRNLSPPEVQREALARQMDLAARHRLPVLVHDRDAHADVTASLLAWTGDTRWPSRGVLHAFSGDAAMAASLAAAGFLVSFALPVAFRSAAGARAAAAALSDTAFLIETDSPYLGPDRDARNEPTNVLRVASEMARLRNTDAHAIALAARRNMRSLLGG